VSVAPLPSVVSQNTIELHAIGHLRDLGSLRIVGILCRRDQQVEDEGGHGRNQGPCRALRHPWNPRSNDFRAECGEEASANSATQKRHAKASQLIFIGLEGQFSKGLTPGPLAKLRRRITTGRGYY